MMPSLSARLSKNSVSENSVVTPISDQPNQREQAMDANFGRIVIGRVLLCRKLAFLSQCADMVSHLIYRHGLIMKKTHVECIDMVP